MCIRDRPRIDSNPKGNPKHGCPLSRMRPRSRTKERSSPVGTSRRRSSTLTRISPVPNCPFLGS
eukprot:3868472-Rhodomonas_salina.1